MWQYQLSVAGSLTESIYEIQNCVIIILTMFQPSALQLIFKFLKCNGWRKDPQVIDIIFTLAGDSRGVQGE